MVLLGEVITHYSFLSWLTNHPAKHLRMSSETAIKRPTLTLLPGSTVCLVIYLFIYSQFGVFLIHLVRVFERTPLSSCSGCIPPPQITPTQSFSCLNYVLEMCVSSGLLFSAE